MTDSPSETEIEITPEMIEAVARELRSMNREFESVREIAERIARIVLGQAFADT